MIRILGLQRADQKFELRKTSQTRKAGIFQEVRPTGKSGADASLEPLKGSFAPSGFPIKACSRPCRLKVRGSFGTSRSASSIRRFASFQSPVIIAGWGAK